MDKRQSGTKNESYIEQAIVQLLAQKIRAGDSLTEVRAMVKICLEEAVISAGKRPKSRGLGIHRLGSILRTWHTEAPYLTYDGLPRPLPTEGRLSLSSLIRRYYASDRLNPVFKRLLDAKLIRRHGNDEWMPVGRTARIAQVTPESLEHVSQGIARYVQTVNRNVTAKHEQDLLFERSCQVNNLPASEFNSFRDYVGQQAIAFLTSVDDWLENRSKASKKSAARHCTAGVHTFAFMIENRVGKPPRKPHKG